MNIAGNVEIMPRLFTLFKTLTLDDADNFVLDLGGSCSPEVWHCYATGGRSTLTIMDSMGYIAANTQQLSPVQREKLAQQTTMALIDSDHAHIHENLLFALQPTQGDGHLCITMHATDITQLSDYVLRLKTIQQGEVGVVDIENNLDEYRIVGLRTVELTPDIAPAATVAGVVDFVLGEAKFYRDRRMEKLSDAHQALVNYTAQLLSDELNGLRQLFQANDKLTDWDITKQLAFMISRAANDNASHLVMNATHLGIVKQETVRHEILLGEQREAYTKHLRVLLGSNPVMSRYLFMETIDNTHIIRFEERTSA